MLNKFACSADVRLSRGKEMETAERQYKVAGIDVHKSMLAVVIADAGREEKLIRELQSLGYQVQVEPLKNPPTP